MMLLYILCGAIGVISFIFGVIDSANEGFINSLIAGIVFGVLGTLISAVIVIVFGGVLAYVLLAVIFAGLFLRNR